MLPDVSRCVLEKQCGDKRRGSVTGIPAPDKRFPCISLKPVLASSVPFALVDALNGCTYPTIFSGGSRRNDLNPWKYR